MRQVPQIGEELDSKETASTCSKEDESSIKEATYCQGIHNGSIQEKSKSENSSTVDH